MTVVMEMRKWSFDGEKFNDLGKYVET